MSLPIKPSPQMQPTHVEHSSPLPYTIFPCIVSRSYSKIYDCSNVSALHVVTSIDTAVHRFNSNEHSFECVYDEIENINRIPNSTFFELLILFCMVCS